MKGFFTMLFTIMMLAYSASSLTLSVGAGPNTVTVPTLLVSIYFLFMLYISGLSLQYTNFIQDLEWIQYFSIFHYGFTALQHSEFLGQNFCPEHKAAELSTCQNYV
ncbi:hypothetical protein A6R68_19706, partial [Neotoma lepida]